uniref:Uncharacterized protein n=1 Tax=Fagus sylvatica TaxID=28930 RepID=A0A2N9J644_FAGSY
MLGEIEIVARLCGEIEIVGFGFGFGCEVRLRSWALGPRGLGLCILPRRNWVRVWVWVWVWSRLKLRVWVANVNVRGLESKMGRELLVEVVVVGGVGGGWMG